MAAETFLRRSIMPREDLVLQLLLMRGGLARRAIRSSFAPPFQAFTQDLLFSTHVKSSGSAERRNPYDSMNGSGSPGRYIKGYDIKRSFDGPHVLTLLIGKIIPSPCCPNLS